MDTIKTNQFESPETYFSVELTDRQVEITLKMLYEKLDEIFDKLNGIQKEVIMTQNLIEKLTS